MTSHSSLNLYFCGGTGGNIGKQITDLDLNTCFIDTSSSNLKGVNESHIFLTPGLDGGGKDRSLVYENFKPFIEDILIRFKPSGQLNVVVASLAGGSGSVIAPLIVKELISKNHNTIVISVDSRHSLKEIDNTIKTLKTFQSIADTTKKPISMFYIENKSRKQADTTAIQFINLLSVLVDKRHTEEFDTRDLFNFINYTKVTDNKPSVSIIEVGSNEGVIPEKNTSIVSTILVTKNKDSTISDTKPEYLSTCIVTDPSYTNEDIRVDNILGKISNLVEELDTLIQTFQDNKKINKVKELSVTSNTEDGIVL